MVNTKITIRQAINQVSDREWTNQKMVRVQLRTHKYLKSITDTKVY